MTLHTWSWLFLAGYVAMMMIFGLIGKSRVQHALPMTATLHPIINEQLHDYLLGIIAGVRDIFAGAASSHVRFAVTGESFARSTSI